MSKTKLGHRGRRRGQAVLLTGAAVFGLATLVAVPSGVSGQSQPPPLSVYSDDFSASDNTAAPGTVQHGTQIAVEVEDLDDLETRTTTFEQRLQAHLDDAGAHQPHVHPTHSHNGGPDAVFNGGAGVQIPGGAPTTANHPHTGPGHSRLEALLAQAIAFLTPAAHAQAQPPPLRVYTPDMGGPSSTAPSTPGTKLDATLDTGIPMLARIDALLIQLNRQLTAHVRNVNAHPHTHPHDH